MNFSARGYADLTSILKPDIAVLEGGYSIEGALPYVNLGIILAMAGLDYSHVKEPRYNAAKNRQSREITSYIHDLRDKIIDKWIQRENIRDIVCRTKSFIERGRSIYYDTDNIMEAQKEKIRVCSDCGGALRIDTESDTGNRALAIHIPIKACEKCRTFAYQWFDEKEADGFDSVFLQDRTIDRYLQKKGGN